MSGLPGNWNGETTEQREARVALEAAQERAEKFSKALEWIEHNVITRALSQVRR